MDDIFVLSSSPQQAASDINAVIQGFQAHGFYINYRKSQLTPTTRLLHLGALIGSAKGQVLLSPDRVQSIKSTMVQVRSRRKVPLLHLSQLLGKMVSCISIIPWARRCTQWLLLPFQKSGRTSSNSQIVLPPQVRLSLMWWTSPALLKACVFLETDCMVLTTDASLLGWGAHMSDQVVQGHWSPAE